MSRELLTLVFLFCHIIVPFDIIFEQLQPQKDMSLKKTKLKIFEVRKNIFVENMGLNSRNLSET